MILAIVDSDKDKTNLESFFVSKSKNYKFITSLQEGIQSSFDRDVECIILDTEKEPIISIERLNIFAKQNETPCVILTNNATLSAKIRFQAKDNPFLTTALYGDEYPDLDKVISFKKPFKNKNKILKQEQKKLEAEDISNILRKNINLAAIIFLFGLLLFTVYQLYSGKVIVQEGKNFEAIAWFAVGLLGIINASIILSTKSPKRVLSVVFAVISFGFLFVKFKLFLPMAIVGVMFLLDLYLVNSSLQKLKRVMNVRKEPRYKVDGYVYVVSSSNSQNFNARLIDLSNSGALLESNEIFIQGEELKINSDSFSVFAEVRRSFKSEDKFRTAVEFHLVTKSNQEKIKEYILSHRIS